MAVEAPSTPGSTAKLDSRAQRRVRREAWTRVQGRVLGVAGIVVVLASWEISADVNLVNVTFTSKPSDIAVEAENYFVHGQGLHDLGLSAKEFVLGFALALAAGLLIGVAIGWWRWLDQLTEPLISFAYASPRIALVPLLILWFGIGVGSKIAVIFLSAVFPIILNTRTGVKTTDNSLVSVARSFKVSNFQLFKTVVLPGAVPFIVTGIRLAIATGLIGMVVGELIASSGGLGYTILYAGNTFQPDLMFVALFVVSVAGVILTTSLRTVERRLERWRPDTHA